MINGQSVIAVITARKGSKGIPGKNIVDICGKPMICYTVEAAVNCSYVDEVMVTTDCEEIAEICKESGASVPFLRREELSTDEATSVDVVVDAVEFYRKELGKSYDVVMLLQPTSPLRDDKDIEKALEVFMEHGMKSLASVNEVLDHPILIREMQEGEIKRIINTKSDVRRQDMPTFYRVNGAIYINRSEQITAELSFNDNEVGYVMDRSHSVDVDSYIDLELVRVLVKNKI
ncbi:MAG: acylneuraminate cytidylyltransferase family protein, partial [Lachnospiraceae bacterium]|nr:acylneuraminate cytidylyltransferase family protein [Lachnospiraceae bacterium]